MAVTLGDGLLLVIAATLLVMTSQLIRLVQQVSEAVGKLEKLGETIDEVRQLARSAETALLDVRKTGARIAACVPMRTFGYNYRLPNLNAALGCAQIENPFSGLWRFWRWSRFGGSAGIGCGRHQYGHPVHGHSRGSDSRECQTAYGDCE